MASASDPDDRSTATGPDDLPSVSPLRRNSPAHLPLPSTRCRVLARLDGCAWRLEGPRVVVEDPQAPEFGVVQGPVFGDPEFLATGGAGSQQGGDTVTIGRNADQAHAGEVDGCGQLRQYVGEERLGSMLYASPWQHGGYMRFEIVEHGVRECVNVTGERCFVERSH